MTPNPGAHAKSYSLAIYGRFRAGLSLNCRFRLHGARDWVGSPSVCLYTPCRGESFPSRRSVTGQLPFISFLPIFFKIGLEILFSTTSWPASFLFPNGRREMAPHPVQSLSCYNWFTGVALLSFFQLKIFLGLPPWNIPEFLKELPGYPRGTFNI